jgi:hypothetical protein
VKELNSVMIRPEVSEKSGIERSGIDGSDNDGMAGIAGIMSRADFVIESIRLGAASSAFATCTLATAATNMHSHFIFVPIIGLRAICPARDISVMPSAAYTNQSSPQIHLSDSKAAPRRPV